MGKFEDKFLKKQFSAPGALEAIADTAAPFVAMMSKPVQGGASVAEPLITSGLKALSYTVAGAKSVSDQDDHGASNYEEFNSTFGQYFGHARITSRAVAGGKTNAAAYLRQLTEILKTSVGSFLTVAERKLLGPIGGHIGRISDVTIGADGEMSLTIVGDAKNFAAGMILQAADGTGNGAPSNVRAGLGYPFQVFVDGDTNGAHIHVATSTANATAGTPGIPSGWVNNDYLFRNGDVAAATDLSDKQVRSLQAWNTLVAADDTYNGVFRGQDSRISGFRLSASDVAGMSVLDRMQLLATVGLDQCGATAAKLFVIGPRTRHQLAQEMQSYGQLQFSDRSTRVGVKMPVVITANGDSEVLTSPSCAESDIWLFTESNLKIYNYDGFPALDDADGNEILKQEGAAGYFIRWHAFNCVTVNGMPHHNGRCNSGN